MVWAAVGISVASSIFGSASKNQAQQRQDIADRAHTRRMNDRADRAQMNAWMLQAEDNGKNSAAADFNMARAAALLPEKANAINEQTTSDDLNTQQQAAASKSEAVVQAAASGSAGASVDQSIQQVDDGAARVQQAIEKNRRTAMMGIGQEYEDLFWAQDAAKKELRLTGQIHSYGSTERGSGAMSAGDWVSGAAAGGSAYISNR